MLITWGQQTQALDNRTDINLLFKLETGIFAVVYFHWDSLPFSAMQLVCSLLTGKT